MMICDLIAVLAMIHSVRSIIPGLSNLHRPPWRGNCQKNFPDECTGNTFCGAPGQCVNGKCQYKCYYCDCVNKTQCYFNAQKQVRCDCTGFGTTGDRCEIDIDECDSEPCQNGGSCNNGVNSYTCSCPDGYTGTNCDEDIDECDSDPCQNGGSCNNGVNSYTCSCPGGYTGTNCEGILPRCTNEVNGFRLCDGGGVGVYHPMQGRLEVYHNDVWGTVCDDYWLDSHYRSNLTFAIPNANAACRTLGYSSGVPKPDAFFGQGVGNIWLDDVGCVGTEQSLYDCPHLPWGSHNCWHGEDVGVVCT